MHTRNITLPRKRGHPDQLSLNFDAVPRSGHALSFAWLRDHMSPETLQNMQNAALGGAQRRYLFGDWNTPPLQPIPWPDTPVEFPPLRGLVFNIETPTGY